MAAARVMIDPSVARASPLAPSRTHAFGRVTVEWAKVRELALKQLNHFISLEPKVLKGDDPEAVHDMRVASRRLQQLLDLLDPEPPKEIRRLRRKIKACRRALSEVRNCDVQLKPVENALLRKRTSHREVQEAIRDYLAERRSQSFDRALDKLSQVHLARAYVRLKAHFNWNRAASGQDGSGRDELPQAATLTEELASEPFEKRVGAALEKAWYEYEAQLATSRDDRDAPALHRARISARRLRYLIEVLHELGVAGSAEVLLWLRKLQQHLGDWHDLEVQEKMLVEMLARPKFLQSHLEIAMAVERLILRHRAVKKRYVDRYFGMTLDSAESQRLKDWVANLSLFQVG